MSIDTEAYPSLSDSQFERLTRYGIRREVRAGDVLFDAGDRAPDLVLVDSGEISVVRAATVNAPEEVVAMMGPGQFVGELNLLTGETVYLAGRVSRTGVVHMISQERFRRLMAEDNELSDLILRAFVSRRRRLRVGGGARSIEIVGSTLSAASLALRTYAARQQLAHLWFDSETADGKALMSAVPIEAFDLPAVVLPDAILRCATPADLAAHLGLSYHRSADQAVDLAVIGGGPAGLAAALYGASEGLATVLVDAIGIGGQAAASSRIENYLGFPSGLSGSELADRAAIQAEKFGAQLSSPSRVESLDASSGQLRVVLTDGTHIATRAAIIATGARYRSLPLERWSDFEGAGIFYAATEIEARVCGNNPSAVVGSANSAGQAALFLASRGGSVTLVARGPNLSTDMSLYLIERLEADPRITIVTSTEVTALHGDSALTHIQLSNRADGTAVTQLCTGLFCFIGAEPATEWLDGVDTDDDGFILTDTDVHAAGLGPIWESLGRSPLPFETSVPAVFAVGDVRLGSMKRVAAAVGEGASAVHSVHAAIGPRL